MYYHLSYISRANHKMSSDELKQLEEEAFGRNVSREITGFLVYDGFHFFQYIEGTQEQIEALFAKIEKDERHASVTRLSDGEVSERILPQWSMKSFLPGDFVAEDRLHIMDILAQKHEKASIPEILKGMRFAAS